MDYNKLLDDWAECIYKKVKDHDLATYNIEDYTFKKGKYLGFSEGLLYAVAMLNRLESKVKKYKIKKTSN